MTTNGSITDNDFKCLEDALIASYLVATEDEIHEALDNLGLNEDFYRLISDLEEVLNTGCVQDTSIEGFRNAYEREKSRRKNISGVAVTAARDRIATFLGAHPDRMVELGMTLQFRQLHSLPDNDVLNIYMDLVAQGLIEEV